MSPRPTMGTSSLHRRLANKAQPINYFYQPFTATNHVYIRLDEEGAADEKLTELAETEMNAEAVALAVT